MKIVSCFTDLKELEPLAEAGADEFYTALRKPPAFSFGFLPPRMLRGAVEKAHGLGRKIALAVNAINSPAFRDISTLTGRIADIDDMGMDAFIVSSPFVLEALSSLKPRLRAELHLSSVQPVFNSRSAAFFARLRVSRIILPNQLAPDEARGLLAFCTERGIDAEIFDYRFFGCAYVNGRCQLHRPGYYALKSDIPDGSFCRLNSAAGGLVKVKTLDRPSRTAELPGLVKRLEARLTGGAPRLADAAAFFDFVQAGVRYVKYGTRHDPSSTKVKKVRALRAMLDLTGELSASLPRAEARKTFIRQMSRWNGEGLL